MKLRENVKLRKLEKNAEQEQQQENTKMYKREELYLALKNT